MGKVTVSDASALDQTGAISIEAYVKIRPNTGNKQVLVEKDAAYAMYVGNTSNDGFSAKIGDGSSFQGTIKDGTTDYRDNSYHMFSFTYDDSSDTATLFVDGTQVAQDTSFTASLGTNNNDMFFGADSGDNDQINGVFDEVRLWSDERTSTEVDNNKSVDLDGSESGLSGLWEFSAGSGNAITDQTSNSNDGTVSGTNEWIPRGVNYQGRFQEAQQVDETGADVTNNNTSNDTENVDSRTATDAKGNTKVFTSSGTFTVPDDVNEVYVTGTGAGGGGGSGEDGVNIGGEGGGGGASAYNFPVTGITPGNNISINIGGGGSGGSGDAVDGGNGGNTSFGNHITLNGGNGGNGRGDQNLIGSGGAGDQQHLQPGDGSEVTAGSRARRITGGDGGSTSATDGGGGGASVLGSGGQGGDQGGSETPDSGDNGEFPGGGGGGSGDSAQQGGAGADGILIITY